MVKFDFNVPQIKICDYRPNNGDYRVFNDVYELLEFVSRYDLGGCFFRGQTGLWDIVSSLYRHHGTENWEKAFNICDVVCKWLKLNERLYPVFKDDEDRILAVAQHYGCPTDFVDLTTNLKTAAYFATENDGKARGDDTVKSNGCIWIFSQSDFDLMKTVIEFELNHPDRHTFDGVPDVMKTKLSKNAFSLLVKINIPELSRLNAQSGCFLWDFGGILKSLIIKNHIGVRLEFKHCENEQNQFKLEKKRLFPFPNQLESEIMNVMTETSRENGLPNYLGIVNISELERKGIRKNGIPVELESEIDEVIEVPSPNDFVPSSCNYIWERKSNINTIFYDSFIEKHECNIINLFQLTPSNILPIVDEILKGLHTNEVKDYLITFLDLTLPIEKRRLYSFENEMLFIDTVLTMQNYYYSSQEISEVICHMMKIIIFLCDKNYKEDNVSITFKDFLDCKFTREGLIDLFTDYYGCEVTALSLVEGYNFSEFCLPITYQILDEMCQKEFDQYVPNANLYPEPFQSWVECLPDNARVFAYQTNPQKIISYEKAKRLFVEFILPQQFLFHVNGWRINFPDYLSKIELPFAGRMLSIISPNKK